MGKIRFTVSDATLQREREVECNSAASVESMLSSLLPQLDLPLNSLDGPVAYTIRNNRSGVQLPASSRVGEVIEENDACVIQPEIVPG